MVNVSDFVTLAVTEAVTVRVPVPRDADGREALPVVFRDAVWLWECVGEKVPRCPRETEGRVMDTVMVPVAVRLPIPLIDCVARNVLVADSVPACPRERDGREAVSVMVRTAVCVSDRVTDGVGVGHTPGNTAGRSTETDGTTTAGLSNGKTMHELTDVVVPVMVASLTTTALSVTVVPEMVDSAQTPASCRTCN